MTETADKAFEALAAGALRLSGDNTRLRKTLDEVLRHFTRYGLPGQRCVTTGWLPAGLVEGWRTTLAELTTPPADVHLPAAAAVDEEPSCALCGCTENAACEGGCAWFPNELGQDLCTACIAILAGDLAPLRVEEIFVVVDPDSAEPGAWVEQHDAITAAVETVKADWASSMGDAPAEFVLVPVGTHDAPRFEVVVNAPDSDVVDDPSGVIVHRLVLHGPHLRPADIWAPGSNAWGVGSKSEHGVTLTSAQMSEKEARRRLENMRALFPEDAGLHHLLRWAIGPTVIVREDKPHTGADQEIHAPASGFPTDNEAISDSNQPPDTIRNTAEGP